MQIKSLGGAVRSRDLILNFETPRCSGTAEAEDFKFCGHIGHYPKYANLVTRWRVRAHVTYF